jgi:hypothetical protein
MNVDPARSEAQIQKSLKPPSEDALAVARALAILHARIHHEAEIAVQRERQNP